jgi:hypothetical protein
MTIEIGAIEWVAKLDVPEAPGVADIGVRDVRTNTNNNLTPSYPTAGIAVGDTFIASIVINADAAHACTAMDTAYGTWILIGSRIANNVAVYVFRKPALGTEAGAASFDWNGTGTAHVGMASIIRYIGGNAGIENAVTRADTGLTNTLPAVSASGVARRAIAVVGWDDNGTNDAHPTGETGGDWQFRYGEATSTGTGDILLCVYDAALANGGTISGGSVTQDVGSQSATVGFALTGQAVAPPPTATSEVPMPAAFALVSTARRP